MKKKMVLKNGLLYGMVTSWHRGFEVDIEWHNDVHDLGKAVAQNLKDTAVFGTLKDQMGYLRQWVELPEGERGRMEVYGDDVCYCLIEIPIG